MIRTQREAQHAALKKTALTRQKLRRSVAACVPLVAGFETLEQRLAFSVAGATLAGPVLTQGSSWTYLITTADNETGSYTNTVIGPASFNGKAVTELDSITTRYTSQSYIGKLAAGDFVVYGSHDESENFGTSDDVYSPYQLLYPASLTAGVAVQSHYTDTYSSSDSGGGTDETVTTEDDSITLVSETKSSVTVPFGTFDAYKVHFVSTTTQIGGDGDPLTETDTSDQWYAPGIGLIKGTDDFGNTYELTNFQAAANHLVFTQPPVDTEEKTKIPTVTVAVKNTDGNVVTDATGSITLSLNKVTGDGKLTGTVTKPLVNGVATFTDLVVDASGTYTLTGIDDASPPVAMAKSAQFQITAAALVWTGKGDGVDWSDPKNWDKNVAPKNTDSLLFPAGSPLNTVNDIASLSISAIDIAGAGYTLSGNAISLTGGLTSEAGTNTYKIDTKLVGLPTIKTLAGKLDIKSVLSGSGGMNVAGAGTVLFESKNTYSGPTTLSGGVTIEDSALTGAFGTGGLTIGVGKVTLNNTGTGPATLENDITFKDGSTLATDPFFELEGNIIIDGKVALQPVGIEDDVNVKGNLTGSGTMTLRGNGTIEVDGDVAATVNLVVQSATLMLGARLQATPTADYTGPSQVTVTGGTLTLVDSLEGKGGIDLQSGTLESSGAPNYSGTVKLENYQGTGAANVNLTPGTSPLGTGLVVISGPSGSADPKAAAIEPTLKNTALVGLPVEIPNRVQFLNGSRLTLSNDITFSGKIDVTGTATLDSAVKAGTFGLTGGVINSGTLVLNTGGTVNLSGDIATISTVREENVDGVVNLEAKLTGIVGGANQFVLVAGTLNLKSGLSGFGGIDVQGGTLTAAGLPNYNGTITVEAAKTAAAAASLQITPAAKVLGSGQLVFAATPKDALGVPLLADAKTTLPLTLDSAVVFQGASLKLKGSVTFAGNNTVTGNNTITAVTGSSPAFSGTQTGTGTLAFVMAKNTITLNGTVGDKVLIEIDGTLPELDLGANLLAPVTADSQIKLKTGTLKFLSTVKGTGGVNLLAGQITTPGSLSSYKGNILISQGDSIQNVLTAAPGKDVFGTGQLKFADAGGGYTLIPKLVNTGGTQALTLDNALVFDVSSSVQTEGSFIFTKAVTLKTDNHFKLSAGSEVKFTGGLDGDGTLQLYGKGTVTVSGTLTANAKIDIVDEVDSFGGSIDTLILGNAVLNGVADQITVHAGTLLLEGQGSSLGPITGGGGINVAGGSLTTDNRRPVGGNFDYTGPITVNSGSTAYYHDSFDSYGFGTGLLTLKGGTFQNVPNSGATSTTTSLRNPITNTGTSTINSGDGLRLKLVSALTLSSGELRVSGDVVIQGLLTGSGDLTLTNNTLLEIPGSNPSYTGKVTTSGGTINVVKDHPLGSGTWTGYFFKVDPRADIKNAMHQVDSVADPIIDNHLDVESGTMDLQGLLTFPAGINVAKSATLEINKGETVVSGPLTGAGSILVADGAKLTFTGDRSGFTGTVTYLGPVTKTTPGIIVTDAGGVFNGNPYPATVTLVGSAGPSATLDGVPPTLAYYVGSTATGTASATAPTNPGTYTVIASFAGSTHYNPVQSGPVTFVITPSAPPTRPTVNGGALQRSMVTSISLAFDQPVTLAVGAMKLVRLNTGGSGANDGSAPTDASAVLGSPNTNDGGVTWTWTFVGSGPFMQLSAAGVPTGSLVDGIYTATLDRTKVSAGGLPPAQDFSFTFHRLFGDANGSKNVNNADFVAMRSAFGKINGQSGFNAAFDFDNTGTVNNADFGQFRSRFLKALTY